MKIDDILEKEEKNKDRIYLYHSGNFWVALEMSAYLLQRDLWQNLKILPKTTREGNNYLRAAFIETSLEKVLTRANSTPKLAVKEDLEKNPNLLIITGFKRAEEEFETWKDELWSLQVKLQKEMEPFYGKLPVYKKSYDLMSLVISTVRNFPKELQGVLGEKIIREIIEINKLFREIYLGLGKNLGSESEGIEIIEEKLDMMMFLLRLAFDQKAFGLKRSVDLVERIGEIKKQLKLWKRSLGKK